MLKAGCYSPSRSLLPWFCFLAAVFASAPALRSADGDKWWPDYAGGPASARYFEADQITKSNVGQLEIAWTYPFGETGSNPIVVAGIVYGRGRNGSLIALMPEDGQGDLDPRRHAGDDRPRHELLGEQGRQGSPADLRHERLPAGDQRRHRPARLEFGNDGVVDLREGLGRDPATIGRIQSGTPGRCSRT